MVSTSRTTAARPCGGDVTLPVTAADYTADGRLMVFLGIDPSGSLDVALAAYAGDPLDMQGEFNGSPIWSDGGLADRLPVYLTIGPDLSVAAASAPPPRPTGSCTPRW